MQKKKKTGSTRELGLDLTQIAARFLFKTEHLHFGYWPSELSVEIGNLLHAQELYSDYLIKHIPPHVRTILDVGSGTGAMAYHLIEMGYAVDCVSPSAFQTQRVRALLGERAQIFESTYEELLTEKRYDLILFSESFQYIPFRKSLPISCGLLKEGGHLLICDFFRKDTTDGGPFGGGHRMTEFLQEIERFPLSCSVDEDITARMAPNLDLVADFVEEVLAPMKERIFGYLKNNHSLSFHLLYWIFRRPLARAEAKYMTGKRRGANFAVYKTYRLLLFQLSKQTPQESKRDIT